MLSVPLPDVEVTMTEPEPYFSGMFAEMRCSIDLADSVDTQVDVEVMWLKDGVELSETARVRALPTHSIGSSGYRSLLQFSTLSRGADGGEYTCLSTVFPTEKREYISNATATTSAPLSMTGNHYNIALTM